MAGCSNTLSLDVVGILGKLQSLGFCLDIHRISSRSSVEELRSPFNRVLSLFLTEISVEREIRPLPAMLGDGRSLDLFRLYLAVRGKGGYDTVSASRSWASVADGIGLDSVTGPSLKLIYVKYLDALDRWLCRVLEEKTAGKRGGGQKDLALKNEVNNGFLREATNHHHKKKDCEGTPPSGSKRNQFLTPVRRNVHKLEIDDRGSGKEDDAGDGANGKFPLKRKWEDVAGMVKWVKRIAKNPNGLSLEKLLSNGDKYRAHAADEHFSHAILARRAMFIKKIPRIKTDGPLEQKWQKTHPSAYADSPCTSKQSKQKTRCSERFRFVIEQTDSGSYMEKCLANGGGNLGKQRLSKDKLEIQIPLGRFYQAKVPRWTGKPSETSCGSDNLKWLGTRIWPPEIQVNGPPSEQHPIGKGRQETCQCKYPDSVECVRFHVAEKRFHLMCELGSAFDKWRFNHMGEEVALSWTEEEQRAFKAIVRLNPPSQQENFWGKLPLSFPQKGRKNLVSYYFNVFLLARRCYQNRVTPNRIDSDDETEYDFLSTPYGHDAVSISEIKHNFCVQNSQCMDLDEYVNGD